MSFRKSIWRTIAFGVGVVWSISGTQGQLSRTDSALLAAESRQAWLDKDYPTALAALRRLREAYPQDDNLLFNLATLYLETGEAAVSLRLLGELRSRNPAFPLVGLKMAFAALAAGDTAVARRHLKEPVPADATADYWRAWAYLSIVAGDTVAAIQFWGRSLREWPENPALYLDLAQFFLLQGDTVKARRELASAELFGAARGTRLIVEALLHVKAARLQEALAALELIKNPSAALEDHVVLLKAWLLARLERWKEALIQLQNIPEHHPLVASLMLTLRSAIHHMRGNFQEALRDARKALELNPGNAAAWLNKGVAFAHLNRLSEACPCWKKAFELGLMMAKTYLERQCY
ncbi:MAG: tetratricopeptide repeat protein [Flavobacteriales bacterium]|nr:tetratricopeptide repeat protein [Flavobacteriales bacterium]MDW8411020.1 tetratricopeptide repeat protein [Flavobacteriales bacterium]